MEKRHPQSAGLLIYRFNHSRFEVFLVHPGGPFWRNKDVRSWSIPKGEFDWQEEDPLDAAIRESEEETNHHVEGEFIELSPVRQKTGKIVYAWAVESDMNAEALSSNTFQMEWPPNSGKYQHFPEIDKGAWCDYHTAQEKLHDDLKPMLRELVDKLKIPGSKLYR